MDYIYIFRHAHQDRLENAGVVAYRPADGFRVVGRKAAWRFTLPNLAPLLLFLKPRFVR